MQKQIIIYGASTSAQNIKNMLEFFKIDVFCFVVTHMDGNPSHINGIPVYEAAEVLPEHKKALVLIALLNVYYSEVKKYLIDLGVTEFMEAGLESEVDIRLRKEILRRKTDTAVYERFLSDIKGMKKAPYGKQEIRSLDDFKIFMVCNHRDKIIKADTTEKWIVPIQAGAANTSDVLAEIRDDRGKDNISERNYNYCELSAAYWIWRNIDTKYIGLCHYRRKFPLTEAQILELIAMDIDICVPLPGLLSPCVGEGFIHNVPASSWYEEDLNRMFRAITVCRPQYEECAREILKGRNFIHYNMLIAKKHIFYEWCDFWYPVLRWVEESYEEEGVYRQDRYLGFLGEILTTIFFYYHREYRSLYAELKFLF